MQIKKTTKSVTASTNLKQEVIDYIMDDTVRKERFSDIEISTADDNEQANDEVKKIVDSYSEADCKAFLEAVKDPDTDIVAGGWQDASGKYFPESQYAKACGDVKASTKISAKKKAQKHIKAAIDALATCGKDDIVAKDNIANLGVVMFDLMGED